MKSSYVLKGIVFKDLRTEDGVLKCTLDYTNSIFLKRFRKMLRKIRGKVLRLNKMVENMNDCIRKGF